MRYKPVILMVLDGWGVARPSRGNAITLAKTPVTDSLTVSFPHGVLSSMGGSVGLPWEEMGNSEVGHLALGTGKVVYQDLMRVNNSIEGGDYFTNSSILKAIDYAKNNGSNFHVMGILSDGGVHGHINHIVATLDAAKRRGLTNAFVHVVLDGRDTERDNGVAFIESLLEEINKLKFGTIASVIGRFWAMDRDEHWLRTKKSYDLIVGGQADVVVNQQELLPTINSYYKNGILDERMIPIMIKDESGGIHNLQNNDSLLITNFRPDRARQITKSLALPTFTKFERTGHLSNLYITTMTAYDESLPVEIVFKQEKIDNSLSSIISEAGLKQLHIGETEKYAHITYFFDGYKENPFPGEDYSLVKSIDGNYDQQPEMGAYTITNKVERAISQNKYDFILINFANPDMVGHTGNIKATSRAVEVVDECVGRILKVALSINGVLLITADHGNAEEMLDLNSGKVRNTHTNNPVPIWLVGKDWQCPMQTKKSLYIADQSPIGILPDVAATVLDLLELSSGADMEGVSLLDSLKC